MSDARVNDTLVNAAGSTRPAAKVDHFAHEEAKIREYWLARVGTTPSTEDLDSACFYRHKSLVLKLARDSYVRDTLDSSDEISPAEYSRRYDWLGNPLQQSIHKMLEVQEYANEHPELFGLSASFEWPKEGDQFLKFLILEELGRGATGRVYLCESRNLGNKQVVLKVEPGENSAEASLLGKLRHSHITPISWADYDPELNATFLCMPFLGRSTLADLVDLLPVEGPPKSDDVVESASRLWMRDSDITALPFDQSPDTVGSRTCYITRIVKLARDLAEGLAFVHRKNMTHGDIKPSNVLLAPGGHVYLLDFNLGRASQTSCSRYGGTAQYMAPELVKQVLQEELRLPTIEEGIAADTFSFGVLLYELLTGRTPYSASTKHGTLESICSEMAQLHKGGHHPAVTIDPAIGKRLSDLIDRCLDFEPTLRPKGMQDIAHELDVLNAPRQRLGRTVRKNPVNSLLLGGLLIGAVSLVGHLYNIQPTRFEQLYQQAAAARSTGDLKATIDCLDEALLIEPKNSAARLLRARSYNEVGEYSLADADLRYLSRFSPHHRNIAYLAYNTQSQGDQHGAALGYEHAIRKGMKNSAILNNLALAYFLRPSSLSGTDLAELTWPVVEEALVLNPNSPQVRMTAFTYYRRHPEHLSEAVIAAAEQQIRWLKKNVPEQSSVTKAIYSYYSGLARHKLIDSNIVEEARQLMSKSTVSEPLDRLLDPLDCEL